MGPLVSLVKDNELCGEKESAVHPAKRCSAGQRGTLFCRQGPGRDSGPFSHCCEIPTCLPDPLMVWSNVPGAMLMYL